MRLHIVHKPKVIPRIDVRDKMLFYSDAPLYAPVPKQHVKPPSDKAPTYIAEFRASLARALHDASPYTHHVAFFKWHQAQ